MRAPPAECGLFDAAALAWQTLPPAACDARGGGYLSAVETEELRHALIARVAAASCAASGASKHHHDADSAAAAEDDDAYCSSSSSPSLSSPLGRLLQAPSLALRVISARRHPRQLAADRVDDMAADHALQALVARDGRRYVCPTLDHSALFNEFDAVARCVGELADAAAAADSAAAAAAEAGQRR